MTNGASLWQALVVARRRLEMVRVCCLLSLISFTERSATSSCLPRASTLPELSIFLKTKKPRPRARRCCNRLFAACSSLFARIRAQCHAIPCHDLLVIRRFLRSPSPSMVKNCLDGASCRCARITAMVLAPPLWLVSLTWSSSSLVLVKV